MSYILVEDFSVEQQSVMVSGRTLPVPSLVEGSDGIRMLLLPEGTEQIQTRVWSRAHASGAAILLCPSKDGTWHFVTAEEFIERRTEDPRTVCYQMSQWHHTDRLDAPTYTQLVVHQAGLDDPAEQMLRALEDEESGEFVHLHTHTEFSTLDGLSNVKELVQAAVADGQKAIASADHGNCAVHPALQQACDEAGIKAIFGMEAYFVPDRHRRGRSWYESSEGFEVADPSNWDEKAHGPLTRRSDAQEALNEYQHVTLWALDQTGLRNLWAMSTESYREGFYGKPRLDWDTLTRHAEGVIASSGCLRGPLAQALLKGDQAKAQQDLARFLEIFPDRYYIEIHTNHLEEQVLVNKGLVQIAREYGVPMVAAVDSHYATPDDQEVHRAWLAVQTNKDLSDDSSLFSGGQDYHLKTAAEVREALAYLGQDVVEQSMAETVRLAARCTARVEGATTTPTFSKPSAEHPDPVQRDVERLLEYCLANWERKVVGKTHSEDEYAERFEREMRLLIDKKFCGYFLIVNDYVVAAKTGRITGKPILAGPGRGSGGGSLVAYLADIVETDPVENDLIFERFLTEGRTSLPDFDLDFPASTRGPLKRYVTDRWGEDYVVSIGTVNRTQSKGAINDTLRVLKPTLPYEVQFTDFDTLKKAIDAADAPLAGKHMPWDDFCSEFSEIVDPLREKYPEIFAMVDRVIGRVRSLSKHAAGVVISTDRPLTDLPMRVDDEGNLVTQFDMVALESLGYVKFDLLTLRTLDTIQVTLDLIEETFGRRPDVYSWKEEYADPQVWDAVSSGQTLGLFQVETKAGTRLTRQYQPQSVHDLAAVMTLVRPGPMRSKLTETYLRRRAGQEPVSFPEPRLEEVLGDTYGAMIYQEQIMAATMTLAGYDSNEADGVRKILGKKQVEKVAAAGEEFIRRAVQDGGTDEQVAIHLWEQMAEFAKYSFNKAHAFGYAVLGYWTAWFKFHYPVQFLTAALSTVDDDRIPEFINEARRMGYTVLGPDINESGLGFTPSQLTVRYGLNKVKGIGDPTAQQIIAGQPYTSLADFHTRQIEPKGSKVNRGHLATLVSVGAFDSLVDNRRAVEMQLEAEASGAAKKCVFKDERVVTPLGLPCTFDWANEPDPPMVAKGRGKDKTFTPKPPPKKCTTACRQYRKPEPIKTEDVQPYTEADIRDRERELLGVWLSSTPFDRLDPETLESAHTSEEIESGPQGEYVAAAIIEAVKEKVDRNGGRYAWVTMNAQSGSIDAICFASTYEKIRADLRKDALCGVILNKTDRGLNLLAVAPL